MSTPLSRALSDASDALHRRSIAAMGALTGWLPTIAIAWTIFILGCGMVRLAMPATPLAAADLLAALAGYVFLALAPITAGWIGLRLFRVGHLQPASQFTLARVGRWRRLDAVTARASPDFGPYGLLTSLVFGLMLSIGFRNGEFLLGVPVPGSAAPEWLRLMHAMMLLDAAAVSALYAFAFAMALRSAPLFPRFLVAVWGCDLLAQVTIAVTVSAAIDLPAPVAASLGDMLVGNVQKTLISIGLWLPYLILSRRANLTFRHRTPLAKAA